MAKKLTLTDFLERAKTKYGDQFDYSQSIFSGYTQPIDIICKTHGVFTTKPNTFLNTNRVFGCPDCAKENKNSKIKLQQKFLDKAVKLFPNLDYSKVEYVNNKSKVKLICNTHGEFEVVVGDFLRSTHGCPQCYRDSTKIVRTLKPINFLEDCISNPNEGKDSLVGTIYIFQNLKNNKIYIGKTIMPYLNRISSHKYDFKTNNTNSVFHKALNKYGWDSFGFGVLYQTEEYQISEENKKIVDEMIISKEIEYIKKYNSNNRYNGYNLTEGGEGIVGYKHSLESKIKMSNDRSGEKHPNYGKKYVNGISLYQLDLEGNVISKYRSVIEAADVTGIKGPNISRCLSRKGTSGGFIWIKEEDYEEFVKDKDKLVKKITNKRNHKEVLCFDEEGNKINSFPNCTYAAKEFNCSTSLISKAASPKDLIKSAKMHYWIYEEDFTKEIYKQRFIRDYE